MASHNIFNNLDEIVDHDDSTKDMVRKAKKKLREIEILKTTPNITPEQKDKIKLEKHWNLFIKSNIKLYEQNKFGITHSFAQTETKNALYVSTRYIKTYM